MEAITYVLAVLVTFLALFLGMLLARLTKEELKPGDKYFKFAKVVLLIIITVISLTISFLNRHIATFAIILILFIILFFTKKRKKETYIYALYGFIIHYSAGYINLFLLESSLIFIYGLIAGTLITKKFINKELGFIIKKIFIRTISYPLIAIILYFTTSVF